MSLEDLLKRVESARGPDRGLDGRIAWALGWRFNGFIWYGDPVGGPDTVDDFDDWPNVGGHWHRPGGQFANVNEAWSSETAAEHPDPPNVTASLDAALALVEEKLPGWTWEVGISPACAHLGEADRFVAHLRTPRGELIGGAHGFMESGISAPLAVLAALLRALISQTSAPKADVGGET